MNLEPAARAGVLYHAVRDQPVPDEEHDDCAHDGPDQTGALVNRIQADFLADEGGDESADDAQQRRQYEPLRIFGPGRQKARNDSGNEPENERPKTLEG